VTVHLVGAGPGDPELISVRGARLLASADVVVHDRLARPLLPLAAPGAEIVDVGKSPGSAPVPQSEINRILVEAGRRYACVVRLKGGDPLVFGRGAEEAAALAAAGVPFDVVPGISSVLAAPAAAGVPVTVRGTSRSFTVLTGHEDPELIPLAWWEALVTLGGTIVVLMGASNIAGIADRLCSAGMPAATPVAAVHAATTPAQHVHRSTLDRIGAIPVPSPATIVIGDVAAIDLRSVPGV
jgi:uroporphyrin-III C-methyltransferase